MAGDPVTETPGQRGQIRGTWGGRCGWHRDPGMGEGAWGIRRDRHHPGKTAISGSQGQAAWGSDGGADAVVQHIPVQVGGAPVEQVILHGAHLSILIAVHHHHLEIGTAAGQAPADREGAAHVTHVVKLPGRSPTAWAALAV